MACAPLRNLYQSGQGFCKMRERHSRDLTTEAGCSGGVATNPMANVASDTNLMHTLRICAQSKHDHESTIRASERCNKSPDRQVGRAAIRRQQRPGIVVAAIENLPGHLAALGPRGADRPRNQPRAIL